MHVHVLAKFMFWENLCRYVEGDKNVPPGGNHTLSLCPPGRTQAGGHCPPRGVTRRFYILLLYARAC